MRRLAVASALLAALLIGLFGALPVAAAPPTDSERAAAALRFLAAAQKPDGSIDGSLGETADFIIGAADNGYDPATLAACSGKTALGDLATASDAAAGDAAKTAKAILAVTAARLDAAAFAGRNLLARLTALYHASNGRYGDGSTFAQALSILAVHAVGGTASAAAVSHLRSLQDSDGSWNFKSAANATDGDTNSTAIALMALASAGDHASDAKALAYLHTQQLPDGGFPYQNLSTFGPPASDPDSDSLVIQALIATGQQPEGAAWTKGSQTPLTHLRSRQAASGGFTFPAAKGPDAFTTSQVPAALAGKPYASTVAWSTGRAVPGRTCAAGPSVGVSGATPSAPVSSLATPPGNRGESEPIPTLALLLALIPAALGGLVVAIRRSRA